MSSELEPADVGGLNRGQDGPARKQLERLVVVSGVVIVIDQFMLANPQFWQQLAAGRGDESEGGGARSDAGTDAIERAAKMYGGAAIRLNPGLWGVYRDPLESLMLVAPLEEGVEPPQSWQDRFDRDSVIGVRGNCVARGRVFIDTRCVVFVDADLLRDRELLEEYRRRREDGDDKGARDMIRERGAAVRYGFNRDGDELGLFKLAEIDCFALWPDVVELEDEGDDDDEF